MKIAVVDANIFIDLIRLKLLDQFFEIGIEIQTTDFVLNQLDDRQQEQLKVKIDSGKIEVHSLTSDEINELMEMRFPRKLEIADRTVFYFARKMEGILVSGDNCLRKHCQSQKLEVHGLVWIFEQFNSKGLLSREVLNEKVDNYLRYAQRAPRGEFQSFLERINSEQ
jgi:predicted nucleic acid-binding protein